MSLTSTEIRIEIAIGFIVLCGLLMCSNVQIWLFFLISIHLSICLSVYFILFIVIYLSFFFLSFNSSVSVCLYLSIYLSQSIFIYSFPPRRISLISTFTYFLLCAFFLTMVYLFLLAFIRFFHRRFRYTWNSVFLVFTSSVTIRRFFSLSPSADNTDNSFTFSLAALRTLNCPKYQM